MNNEKKRFIGDCYLHTILLSLFTQRNKSKKAAVILSDH